jgi:hypothetical protein
VAGEIGQAIRLHHGRQESIAAQQARGSAHSRRRQDQRWSNRENLQPRLQDGVDGGLEMREVGECRWLLEKTPLHLGLLPAGQGGGLDHHQAMGQLGENVCGGIAE